MFEPRSLTADEVREHASKLDERRAEMNRLDAKAGRLRVRGKEWSVKMRREFGQARVELDLSERCRRLEAERKA